MVLLLLLRLLFGMQTQMLMFMLWGAPDRNSSIIFCCMKMERKRRKSESWIFGNQTIRDSNTRFGCCLAFSDAESADMVVHSTTIFIS